MSMERPLESNVRGRNKAKPKIVSDIQLVPPNGAASADGAYAAEERFSTVRCHGSGMMMGPKNGESPRDGGGGLDLAPAAWRPWVDRSREGIVWTRQFLC